MADSVHVLGISGSLRRGSMNTALLHNAAEMLPDGMTLEIFDISPIPLFSEDIEVVGYPEPVQYFKARIAAADALLIATPEYNYSIPGVLKNAIDWASRPISATPLSGKPVAIMGAGGRFGTVRAQLHLRQICVFLNLLPLAKPELIIERGSQKFDAAGRLTDETARQTLRQLLEALSEWTLRLRGH